jgi:hypothetical protein
MIGSGHSLRSVHPEVVMNWAGVRGAALCLAAGTLTASLGGGQPPTKEVNTPPARGERKVDALKVGDTAPDFTLKTVDGKKDVTLSEFRGKKPVVLIFASYT